MTRTLDIMSRDERSLLIFFEDMEVNQRGFIDDMRKMNSDDIATAQKWNDEGFCGFKRAMRRGAVSGDVEQLTYAVNLSDEAWALAHQERRARSARMKAVLEKENATS